MDPRKRKERQVGRLWLRTKKGVNIRMIVTLIITGIFRMEHRNLESRTTNPVHPN